MPKVEGRHDSDKAPIDTISDEQIREMLRDRSVLERHPKTIRALEKLTHFDELPTAVLFKILGLKPHGGSRLGIVDALEREGYVMMRQTIFNHRRQNMFKITAKGKQAVKEARKK